MSVAGGFVTAATALAAFQHDVSSGIAPTIFRPSSGPFARIEWVAPGMVTLFGGPPGAGKTALVMQLITEILLSTPDIRAMVANVEMPPGALVDRQFSRLSNIPLTDVRHREFEETDPEPVAAIAQLQSIGDRLAFHRGPFSLTALAGSVNTFGAHIVLLDYIQRFIADGEHGSTRDAVSAIMSQLRLWADNGAAVIAVSAVARNRNRTGSTYQGLGLASFRDSSELEFGGDDVFMLTPPDHDDLVVLQQLKSRYGECRNLTLRFDRYHQRFSTTPHQLSPRPATPPEAQLAELTRIWDRSEHGT